MDLVNSLGVLAGTDESESRYRLIEIIAPRKIRYWQGSHTPRVLLAYRQSAIPHERREPIDAFT